MFPYLLLAVGVLVTSLAAIFIRLADAPALVIAAGRMCVASSLLVPVAVARARPVLRTLKPRDWVLAVASGLFLALHFALWIASLQMTTVASSLVMVTTSPLWVALATLVLFRERLAPLAACGILTALIGGLLVGGGDLSLGGETLTGDLLALGGGIAVAGYFLLGRRLRARLSLLPYVTIVYSIAAIALLGAVLLSGLTLGGYSTVTYAMIVLLAIGPQIVGHSSYNFALRYFAAATISVTTLGEPIASTALAALVLRETPPPATYAGGALVLAGIAAVLISESRPKKLS